MPCLTEVKRLLKNEGVVLTPPWEQVAKEHCDAGVGAEEFFLFILCRLRYLRAIAALRDKGVVITADVSRDVAARLEMGEELTEDDLDELEATHSKPKSTPKP